jgi:hypothetical protein
MIWGGRMDKRVTALWDRLVSYCEAQEMPIVELRAEVLRLHAEVDDPESRIALMNMFNLICDVVVSHLHRTGGDLMAFEAHRKGQIWMFLRAECMSNGVLDREQLRAVTEREVLAGRMKPDDRLRRFALGEEGAFDDLHATFH